jgi:C-terminal processing protease CtpA/Prc
LLDADAGAPPCDHGKSYWGIGMQFDLENIVINAPETYPAYHAGIRVGDVVTDRDIQPDEQGFETVDFTRRGKSHRLRIRTEWICLR